MSKTMGIPSRRHPKKTMSSDCQHTGTAGSLLRICSHGLQNDISDGSLFRQSRKRLHKANLQALHHQPHLRWFWQHMRWNLNMWSNMMFSDRLRFCLRHLDRRTKVGRGDTEMKFSNQRKSHTSTVWDQTLSSKMTTLVSTEWGLSETTSRIWEWR